MYYVYFYVYPAQTITLPWLYLDLKFTYVLGISVYSFKGIVKLTRKINT